MVSVEAVFWYLFLLDSLGAVIVSFCCAKWAHKKFPVILKHLPLTKGWALIYFGLVLWIGSALNRMGVVGW